MNPSYQLEMGDHIHVKRDVVQQGETSFSSLPTACSGCQPLLMSLNKRICSLEAEFEKLKRKQRKGKVVIENEVAEKEDPNEERFSGLTKLIEDATDAKSAVEALARQLYSSEELHNSSVTGFQCNKDYTARPGLSPSRRSILESIVLRKGFPAFTRSSVRKDLGLVLKKARANKENKAKCRGKEQRKL
ncbi:hypothetical protein AWC38_SpisGene21990 [Stylophora pistillata]|uniref:BEN domain-containing protein n=1 Tax=Stylophora pistillata TaxID=50429 RepID=A0A2B4RC70_STYPI|nr:hypothetical protein AWC38_SpisGene21990 [Stylophora pistillata]